MKIAKFKVRGEPKAIEVFDRLRGVSPFGWDSPPAHFKSSVPTHENYKVWQYATDFEFTVPVPDDRVDQFKKIVGNIPFTFQGE